MDIKVTDDNKIVGINSNIEMYYQSEYIPNGFELGSIKDLGDTKIIIYINEDNEEIVFNQSPNGTNFKIDSEDAIVNTIDINGKEAILLSKEGMNTLFWYDEEYSFYLLSTVNHDELILMAESIIKK